MTADARSPESADRLRADLVAALRERGSIRSPEVAAAFTKVPRERFAPEAPLDAAYSARDVVVTKRDPDGRATSSISAPWLQAEMLEAARLTRGARVLEIGSGGYNAALIAEIVGPDGFVVTVDIDPWVTERAARFLADTGYPQVKVVLGDAEHAADEYGPYDAILVTAGAWDCPWGRLLAPEGRMVVPLRFATITRSITFVRDGDRLQGLDATVCGFIPMQGAGAYKDREAVLADGAVKLTIEDGPELDIDALGRALVEPRTELWTGVEVGRGEPFDTLNLWLATVEDRFGMIWQDPDRDRDLVQTALRWYCPALISRDSFAYLTLRDAQPHATAAVHYELGVYGHGRHGAELARPLRDQIKVWDRTWRHHPGPAFSLHPADATVPHPAVGRIFRKQHTQLVMAWA
ncbi:methyltransferase, FxLD system [Microbispora sitophila]|uniref:methyltransferase, FxLD system n=1 Tax=Microbispora sitophila TaxID=2771537 RepID=UPI00299F6F13|nr:methyltransferase, FxLD system [Microbispora sitophila]